MSKKQSEEIDRIAAESAYKFYGDSVKTNPGGVEATAGYAIIKSACVKARGITTTEYAKGWDDHVAAVRASQPKNEPRKCSVCGHLEGNHVESGCGVPGCKCGEFETRNPATEEQARLSARGRVYFPPATEGTPDDTKRLDWLEKYWRVDKIGELRLKRDAIPWSPLYQDKVSIRQSIDAAMRNDK